MNETTHTTTKTTTEGAGERLPHKLVYPTLEEAKAVTPPSDKFKLYAVTHHGQLRGYAWGWAGDVAVAIVAKEDGYAAHVAEGKSGVTVEAAVAKLTGLCDDELAALGLKRVKGRSKP